MSPRPRPRRALAAALLAAALPASAVTLQPLDGPPRPARPIELHPYVGYAETYDSNIFLLPQAVSSWIHTPMAGVRVPAAFRERHFLDLSYDFADRMYSHSKESGLGNALIHSAQAKYWYLAPSGLALRARDAYLNTIDPESTELTGLRRRWVNEASAQLGFEPQDGGFLFDVDGAHARHKYVTDPVLRVLLDRSVTLFGARAGWQLAPKTTAYAAYHRQLIHFTDDPSPSRDSRGNLVDFGVEGDLGPKTTGRAQVGLVDRSYDAPASAGQDTETRNFTALVDATWRPLDRSRATLAFTRTLEESAFDISQFYVATALRLSLAHDFPSALSASVNGGVEWDKYPVATQLGGRSFSRRDDNYFAGASVERRFGSRLRAGVSYAHRSRFSKGLNDVFGFRDDVTSVSLSLAY